MRETTTIVELDDPVSDAHQAIVPVPHGYTPEGVSETIIDPGIIHLIEQTIPGGRELFAHILHYATLHPSTTMQMSLFHATGEANNEAIVLISNVEALAKSANSPFRSPDAYSRRLLALESLRVIRRKLHRTFTEIRIPLGKRSIHIPSLLAQLWELHETYKDTKVKQLARKMAKQLKTGEFLAYASSTCMHVDEELVPVMRVLDSLLQARGIKEEVSTLASACGIIAQLMLPEKYGRVGDSIGEFVAAISSTRPSPVKKSGELLTNVGELLGEASGGCEGTEAGTLNHSGELVVMDSPEFAGAKKKKRNFRMKTGEFQHLFATNSPDLALFGRVADKMGELVASVSLSDHYSVSNILSKRTESLNDDSHTQDEKQGEGLPTVYKDPRPIEEIRRDARDHADLLDGKGNYRWMGKLVGCVQNRPEPIRHLAVIDTLFHSAFPDWRGKPSAPGAWFCKAADRFDTPDAKIPHEVRLWAETGLPYDEIDKALQQGRKTPMDHLLPLADGDDEPQIPLEGAEEDGQQETEPVLSPVRGVQACSGLRTRMNASQAEELCQCIRREGMYYGVVAEVRRGERGTSIVVTRWDGTEEVHVNEGEWERYFSAMKSIL